MKKPSAEDIASRVGDIEYLQRAFLPFGDPRRVYIGGAALAEARRYAERAKVWLEKRGLGEDGKPVKPK